MICTMDYILKKAKIAGYCVPAPNVWNMETIKSTIMAAEEMNSPIILDYGEGGDEEYIFEIGLLARFYGDKVKVPVAINLDHGQTFKGALRAIKAGFTSIMVDRSYLPFEDNVAETKELVKIAHALNVSVEAELGHVGQGEDYNETRNLGLTKPEEALRFIEETNIDCLAVAIGTSHGTYKGIPYLDFELLTRINNTVDLPLVLHGGSGTGDDNLIKAIKIGIQKINLFTDLSNAGLGGIKSKIEIDTYNKINFGDKTNLISIYEDGILQYKEALKMYIKMFGSTGKA